MDPIQFPENLTELSAEQVEQLANDARAQLSTLTALTTPTPAEADEAERLHAGLVTVDEYIAALAAAPDRMAAVREAFNAEPEADPEPEPEPEADPEPESEPEPEDDTNDQAAGDVSPGSDTEETSVDTASLDTASVEGQRPASPALARAERRFNAGTEIPGVEPGTELTLTEVAAAMIDRWERIGPPTGKNQRFGGDLRTFGTAQIDKGIPADLVIHDGMSYPEKLAVLDRAVDESRLPKGSLVAAGGWCAPSETSYDLADDGSTRDGLLSLPEVGFGRGGVRFTMGPDFADIYALDNFFKMTEAQAIAGSFTKPCFTVECPEFDDFRMDAYGYCFQVPFLTEAAYPEVIRRYLAGSAIAYAHKINVEKIAQVEALLPAAETAADIGTTTASLAAALQLLIDRERGVRRWSFTQAVEVVLPYWVRGALKLDIGLRTGRNSVAVSDAEVAQVFSNANASPQWIYDWQMLEDDDLAYPSEFDMLIYKAGTFVVGTTSVVNLSSVYDAASLKDNIYTAAFFEEGMVVVKRGFGGIKVTVPVCNSGKTGAANIDLCPVGP